jgi:hypothetical protein
MSTQKYGRIDLLTETDRCIVISGFIRVDDLDRNTPPRAP